MSYSTMRIDQLEKQLAEAEAERDALRVELTRLQNKWETPCPKRADEQHCSHWYDGEACHACGAPAEECSSEIDALRAEVERLREVDAWRKDHGIQALLAQARREERERSAERALDFLPLEHEVGAEAERAHERVRRIAAAIRALGDGAEDDSQKYENRIRVLAEALGTAQAAIGIKDTQIQFIKGERDELKAEVERLKSLTGIVAPGGVTIRER